MLVSVVIPAYNVEGFIADCLNSVLSQSYTEIEIICIDDGSEDNTYSILSEYSQRNPDKIQLLKQNNLGAPVARNRGLEIARGEFIQFLDGDDFLLPDKIARQVKMIKNSENPPDFIAGNYIWKINGLKRFPAPFANHPWIDLLKGTLGTTCSNLWNKKSVNKINGWGIYVSSSQETDLMFRLLKNSAVVLYDAEPQTYINLRSTDSISSKNRSESYNLYIKIRIEIVNFLKEHGMFSNDIRDQYYKIMFNTIRLLFSYNPQLAIWYYKDIFPDKLPVKYLSHSSLLFRFLFLIFNFRKAEQIIRIFRRYKG